MQLSDETGILSETWIVIYKDCCISKKFHYLGICLTVWLFQICNHWNRRRTVYNRRIRARREVAICDGIAGWTSRVLPILGCWLHLRGIRVQSSTWTSPAMESTWPHVLMVSTHLGNHIRCFVDIQRKCLVVINFSLLTFG